MHAAGFERWPLIPAPYRAVALTLIWTSGCAGTGAALAGECNQTDSTVTCCLKQNPGQYERCGTTPPAPTQPLVVGPPGIGSQGAMGLGESKADKQKRCLPQYVACIDKIGLRPGGVSGTSHCQDCYNYCVQHGFWPLSLNGQPCPEDRR